MSLFFLGRLRHSAGKREPVGGSVPQVTEAFTVTASRRRASTRRPLPSGDGLPTEGRGGGMEVFGLTWDHYGRAAYRSGVPSHREVGSLAAGVPGIGQATASAETRLRTVRIGGRTSMPSPLGSGRAQSLFPGRSAGATGETDRGMGWG